MTLARPLPTRQKRSEKTLARILEAAMALLAKGDLQSLGLEAIAQEAGVAVGTLYRRFRNKDDLLAELLRQVLLRQLAALDEALAPERWVGIGLAARVSWIAARQVAAGRRAPGLVSAAFSSVLTTPLSEDEEAVRLNQAAVDRIVQWILVCHEEVIDADPAVAARIALTQLFLSLNIALLHPIAFAPLGADEVVDRLTAQTIRALCGGVRSEASG